MLLIGSLKTLLDGLIIAGTGRGEESSTGNFNSLKILARGATSRNLPEQFHGEIGQTAGTWGSA
ncbi:MAG TPA: hypothetical protein PLF23_07755, partial [Candidatus Obscuribacter sp.]|nr:hypothetical protein [Candidatus Obscuribacter sp.]